MLASRLCYLLALLFLLSVNTYATITLSDVEMVQLYYNNGFNFTSFVVFDRPSLLANRADSFFYGQYSLNNTYLTKLQASMFDVLAAGLIEGNFFSTKSSTPSDVDDSIENLSTLKLTVIYRNEKQEQDIKTYYAQAEGEDVLLQEQPAAFFNVIFDTVKKLTWTSIPGSNQEITSIVYSSFCDPRWSLLTIGLESNLQGMLQQTQGRETTIGFSGLCQKEFSRLVTLANTKEFFLQQSDVGCSPCYQTIINFGSHQSYTVSLCAQTTNQLATEFNQQIEKYALALNWTTGYANIITYLCIILALIIVNIILVVTITKYAQRIRSFKATQTKTTTCYDDDQQQQLVFDKDQF